MIFCQSLVYLWCLAKESGGLFLFSCLWMSEFSVCGSGHPPNLTKDYISSSTIPFNGTGSKLVPLIVNILVSS